MDIEVLVAIKKTKKPYSIMKSSNCLIHITFFFFILGCSPSSEPKKENIEEKPLKEEILKKKHLEKESKFLIDSKPKSQNLEKQIIENDTIFSKDRKELSSRNQEKLVREIRREIYRLEDLLYSNFSGNENELYKLRSELRKLDYIARRFDSLEDYEYIKRELIKVRREIIQFRNESEKENKKRQALEKNAPKPKQSQEATLNEEEVAERRKKAIEEKKNLIKGKIAYRIQDSMFVNSISRVAMTISENEAIRDTVEKVIQNLTVVGNQSVSTKKDIKIESIEIGKKMRARLVDPQAPTFPAFNITDLSSETQLVDLNSIKPTSWQWDVYPLKVGDYILNLVVDVVMYSKGEETPVTIPVFDKEVTVSANISNDKSMLSVASPDEVKGEKPEWDTLSLILLGIIALILISGILIYRVSTKKNDENLNQNSFAELIQKLIPKGINEDKVKKLIKEDRTEKALDLMEEYTKKNKEIQNQIIIHKSRLNNLKRKNTIGTTSDEELNSGRTKVNLALLKIIDEFKHSD